MQLPQSNYSNWSICHVDRESLVPNILDKGRSLSSKFTLNLQHCHLRKSYILPTVRHRLFIDIFHYGKASDTILYSSLWLHCPLVCGTRSFTSTHPKRFLHGSNILSTTSPETSLLVLWGIEVHLVESFLITPLSLFVTVGEYACIVCTGHHDTKWLSS